MVRVLGFKVWVHGLGIRDWCLGFMEARVESLSIRVIKT